VEYFSRDVPARKDYLIGNGSTEDPEQQRGKDSRVAIEDNPVQKQLRHETTLAGPLKLTP
jgi:hypothetical protein